MIHTEPRRCPLCGQTHLATVEGPYDRPACAACLERARQPQGEAVRLFNPAPAQMPGQTAFDPNSIRDRYRTPRFSASRENPGT